MYTFEEWKKNLIIVRGGGDIATGTIYKLYQSRFPVLVLEIANPSCIRRTISFCEAVFDKKVEVEGVTAKRAESLEDAFAIYGQGQIPVMIDENGSMIQEVQPPVVVDAILAKRNLGTKITDAPAVIGVGPGFCAGKDVDAVIETQRGHNLGRVIYEGQAGDILADIEGTPVKTLISGVIRGMIREGYDVKKGLKIADVDPRVKEQENCYHISDKARCVAGGVLEAILHLLK